MPSCSDLNGQLGENITRHNAVAARAGMCSPTVTATRCERRSGVGAGSGLHSARRTAGGLRQPQAFTGIEFGRRGQWDAVRPLRPHRHRQRPGRRVARAPAGAHRQAHPAARARRLPAALARPTGTPRRCSSTAVYQAHGDLVRRGRRGRSIPACTISSAATPRSTAPRCSACASAISASVRHKDGVSPAWPLEIRRLRAVLRRGRAPVPRARPARRGPERAAGRARPYPVPAGVARAAHPGARATASPRRACIRSTCRSASCSTRTDGRPTPTSACIRCDAFDGFPCLLNGKADAQVMCVDPALAAHPNVTLLTGAYVTRLETDAAGRSVTARARRRGRARRSGTRPTSWWSPAARCPRRCCCCARPTTRIRTAWPTAPARSGATTCGTTSPC